MCRLPAGPPGNQIIYMGRAGLRGLWAGLQAKLYPKFAYKTSNYEKVMYAISV